MVGLLHSNGYEMLFFFFGFYQQDMDKCGGFLMARGTLKSSIDGIFEYKPSMLKIPHFRTPAYMGNISKCGIVQQTSANHGAGKLVESVAVTS